MNYRSMCLIMLAISILLLGCSDTQATEDGYNSYSGIDNGGSTTDQASSVGYGDADLMAGEMAGEYEGSSEEQYEEIEANPFISVEETPVSTFSIDVDTASYANIRRFLKSGQLPNKDAVRVEEMINYFDYSYPLPQNEHPFSVNIETARCLWNENHRLMRIGLKGKEIVDEDRTPSNLVFLIDVSGSMSASNKLPLLVKTFKLLVNQLGESDRVAIVVYAGASGLVLDSTPGADRSRILDALSSLQSGGSTNGGEGIQLAYQVAFENLIQNGNNRVILATDGDFNVGITDNDALIDLVKEKAKLGIFLTVLGFGTGNLNDALIEQIADQGNGAYAYIDSMEEAKKVFETQISGTLYTIAKDVKIQVEFNPEKIKAYRLIGYENRVLNYADFQDDTKDAGDIGSGHTVTAFYQIVAVGEEIGEETGTGETIEDFTPIDDWSGESVMEIRLRYKQPDGDESLLIKERTTLPEQSFTAASLDFRFAAAVADFGLVLRNPPSSPTDSLQTIYETANGALGTDEHGYREEFLELVQTAKSLYR